MPGKALVLDANILIRAVLGQRVRIILESHAERVSFFVPETAYLEAEEHDAAGRCHPGSVTPAMQARSLPMSRAITMFNPAAIER
jgi:hypothetical protein